MSTALEFDVRDSETTIATRPSSQRRWRHVTPPKLRPATSEPSRAESAAVIDLDARTAPHGEPGSPVPLLVNLARCVIEILAGVRQLDQLSRWVSDEVHLNLLRRVTIAARSRAITGAVAQRPRLTISEPRVTEPVDGVVEAVVMVHQPARSRAVAIRLESSEARWRATAITVL
ncbi:Rv3235 family protein [Leifsonia sp. NPDC058292]|uniref:Rv3235 family protein n=1 Tax=Leifsonia sp. NPDC058292 TaxID=3346428 RepID=UPI0036DA9764